MPSKNGIGLYDEESIFPASPGAGQDRPKESIRPGKPWAPQLSIQNGELLPKSEVFQGEIRARPESGWNQ